MALDMSLYPAGHQLSHLQGGNNDAFHFILNFMGTVITHVICICLEDHNQLKGMHTVTPRCTPSPQDAHTPHHWAYNLVGSQTTSPQSLSLQPRLRTPVYFFFVFFHESRASTFLSLPRTQHTAGLSQSS